jgi:hypothetical protein
VVVVVDDMLIVGAYWPDGLMLIECYMIRTNVLVTTTKYRWLYEASRMSRKPPTSLRRGSTSFAIAHRPSRRPQ